MNDFIALNYYTRKLLMLLKDVVVKQYIHAKNLFPPEMLIVFL
jgi:hypothetical protein